MSYLFGFIGGLALAFVIVKFARRYPAAGIVFTYVRAVFGGPAGFTAGWLYLAAWVFGVPILSLITTNSLLALLALHGITVSWLVFFIPIIFIFGAINYVGVKPSVRIQILLELVAMGALALVAAFVLAKGGFQGHSLNLEPFDPKYSARGWGGIGYGMIFGFSAIAGFEGSAAVGRETRNPRKAIPRAIIYTLIGAGVFFVYVTYALSIGYGAANGHVWASDSTPLSTITRQYAGSVWAQVVDVLIAISAFGSGVGVLTLTSRVLYDMTSRGINVPWLARIHKRFRTPSHSIVIICAVALVTGLLIGELTTPTTVIGFLGTTTSLGIVTAYLSVAVAGFWMLNRAHPSANQKPGSRIANVVLPMVAAGLLGYTIYSSLHPVPAFPYSLAPYIVVVYAIIGLAIYWRGPRGIIDALGDEADQAIASGQPDRGGQPGEKLTQ